MVVYADKEAFSALGQERVTPSTSHLMQDCYICKCPMDLVPVPELALDTSTHEVATRRPHAAVRIIACNHIHGAECLDAWLEVGKSCPTCKRLLFEEDTRREITSADIQAVTHSLARHFRTRDVKAAICRYLIRQGTIQAQLLAEEEDRSRTARATKTWEEIQEAAEAGDDWFWSDGEDMDFEFDEEGEANEEEEEERGNSSDCGRVGSEQSSDYQKE